MLPTLRVKSLIREADDQYITETNRHRERMLEAQADRDLAGFYVYQNYLKRLRRLHRNYVKKYRDFQQTQQVTSQPGLGTKFQYTPPYKAPPSFLPNSNLKSESTASLGSSTSGQPSSKQQSDWPEITRFRIPISSVAQSQDSFARTKKGLDQSESVSQTTHLPRLASKADQPIISSVTAVQEEWDVQEIDEDNLGRQQNPIYIPCGRENSELRLQKRRLRKKQERDRGGALSFRMWRNVNGFAATPNST